MYSGERAYDAAAVAAAAVAFASSAAATAGLTFFPSLKRTRGGGARFRRPSRERTRTTARAAVSQGIYTERERELTMRVDRARHAVRDFDV